MLGYLLKCTRKKFSSFALPEVGNTGLLIKVVAKSFQISHVVISISAMRNMMGQVRFWDNRTGKLRSFRPGPSTFSKPVETGLDHPKNNLIK